MSIKKFLTVLTLGLSIFAMSCNTATEANEVISYKELMDALDAVQKLDLSTPSVGSNLNAYATSVMILAHAEESIAYYGMIVSVSIKSTDTDGSYYDSTYGESFSSEFDAYAILITIEAANRYEFSVDAESVDKTIARIVVPS